MSSGITKDDGMVYVGATPMWHGLGEEIPENATIEQVREIAHLGWTAEVAPLFFDIAGVRYGVRERVIFRSDTQAVLDVVGPDYIPVQNDEALEFFREYLATGSMYLDTAGSLYGGLYVWGLGKMKVEFTLAGGDVVRGYLLVANANKYGRGLIVKFVLERVVCANTLAMALNESGVQISIPHNKKFDEAARADAKRKLGLAVDISKNLEAEANAFVKLQLTDEQVNHVLGKTFELTLDPEEEIYVENRRAKRVRELYEGDGAGAKLLSAAGTGWGLLNAVTQYMDHEAGTSQAIRVRNNLFETGGQAIKNRARTALWGLSKKGTA